MVITGSEKCKKQGEDDVKKTEEAKEGKYGCFGIKPSCLQCMNNIRCHVLWRCVHAFFEGFVVNGVISVVLVALERRFSLPSSRSGLIASSNDFGAVLFAVLIGYWGEQRHKPKLMSAGILILALGCFIFTLPHFIGGKYIYTISADGQNSTENMCNIGSSNTSETCDTMGPNFARESTAAYFALLLIGNLLMGLGNSPQGTLGATYIDENCKPKLVAFYISWSACASAVGVAIGYIVGGQTLNFYVDVNTVDTSSVQLTPKDPQWVGAWWIGPLIGLCGFLLVAPVIYGFPRRLPKYNEYQKQRVVETHRGGDKFTDQANFGKSWKDFPRSIWLLIRNPTFVLLSFGAMFEALIVGGMATFGAKMVQEKFNVDISYAGTAMGIITIPGSGGGMLLGGYLVKRFKLTCRGIIRLCAGFMLAAFCFGPFMLAHCSSDPIVGLDKAYMVETSASGLVSDCNTDCGCSTGGFEPVCVQNVVYFTPCHAGCQSLHAQDNINNYYNCTCLSNTTVNTGSGNTDYTVTSGLCSEQCPWVWGFLLLFLIVMMLTFATVPPGMIAQLRCVPHKQRSLAVGVSNLFIRLVGMTPGPILLGAILDSSCKVWQDSCGSGGSCWVYDKSVMGIRMMLWFMSLKICGFLVFCTASFIYKPPQDDSNEEVVEVAHISNMNIDTPTFTRL